MNQINPAQILELQREWESSDRTLSWPAFLVVKQGEIAYELETTQRSANRELLEKMADRGEILDYFIRTFRYRHYEIACILMNGFAQVDYDNIKAYLAEDEPSQSEMDIEEGEWFDRQRI